MRERAEVSACFLLFEVFAYLLNKRRKYELGRYGLSDFVYSALFFFFFFFFFFLFFFALFMMCLKLAFIASSRLPICIDLNIFFVRAVYIFLSLSSSIGRLSSFTLHVVSLLWR
jgi:hypothetical protein